MQGRTGRLLLSILVILAIASSTVASAAQSRSVTLAWDPNPPEEGVIGYVLLYGRTSRHDPVFGSFESEVDVGLRTQQTVQLPHPDEPYFFSVVAYNRVGLRSGFSVEVMAVPPGWETSGGVPGGGTATGGSGGGGGGGCFIGAAAR